ncbi:hypothetical protein M422DRAFT_151571 [Sphaerobolus stellatus SS14]|nr:hypothetical protein M422DRAFT_151571 [Sphaerobolus stellatus SS14]
MSSIKVDWDRIVPSLIRKRPVLLFDHRGIGESTEATPNQTDRITLEVMAKDLVALVKGLGWSEVDILGFSMGGSILQQLLLLPVHPTRPIPLPFKVRHALLTGTLASPLKQPFRTTLSSTAALPAPGKMTKEQKLELARPFTEASLGPAWVADPNNKARLDLWLERAIYGRPFKTILRQRQTLGTFDFTQQLQLIDPLTKILVIHGTKDIIVPFSHAEEIMRCCPQAKMVQLGSKRGQVPSYTFGHIWYEYFEPEVWHGVIDTFLDDEDVVARL